MSESNGLMRVSSTEVQNNFGKYLNLANLGEEVIITCNGKDVAQLVPCNGECIVSEEATRYFDNSEYIVTYEEFLKIVEASELRYELIDGRLYNLASPDYEHQEIVSELNSIFRKWFKGKKCRPITSSFDVTLVAEVLTKSTRSRDMLIKLDLYMKTGINEYWKVDTLSQTVQIIK